MFGAGASVYILNLVKNIEFWIGDFGILEEPHILGYPIFLRKKLINPAPAPMIHSPNVLVVFVVIGGCTKAPQKYG